MLNPPLRNNNIITTRSALHKRKRKRTNERPRALIVVQTSLTKRISQVTHNVTLSQYVIIQVCPTRVLTPPKWQLLYGHVNNTRAQFCFFFFFIFRDLSQSKHFPGGPFVILFIPSILFPCIIAQSQSFRYSTSTRPLYYYIITTIIKSYEYRCILHITDDLRRDTRQYDVLRHVFCAYRIDASTR